MDDPHCSSNLIFYYILYHKEDGGDVDEVSRKTVFPGQLVNGGLMGGRTDRGGREREKADVSLTFLGGGV